MPLPTDTHDATPQSDTPHPVSTTHTHTAPGSFLRRFFEDTHAMSPEERAAYLETPPADAPSMDEAHAVCCCPHGGGRNGVGRTETFHCSYFIVVMPHTHSVSLLLLLLLLRPPTSLLLLLLLLLHPPILCSPTPQYTHTECCCRGSNSSTECG